MKGVDVYVKKNYFQLFFYQYPLFFGVFFCSST